MQDRRRCQLVTVSTSTKERDWVAAACSLQTRTSQPDPSL